MFVPFRRRKGAVSALGERLGDAVPTLQVISGAVHADALHDAAARTGADLGDFLDAHRELWARPWQRDLHIVGETNLGEIRFDPGTGEVIPYLWWWRPKEAMAPSPATEYRATLRPPAPGDAPPLPRPLPRPLPPPLAGR